jgi:hypothetical protein
MSPFPFLLFPSPFQIIRELIIERDASRECIEEQAMIIRAQQDDVCECGFRDVVCAECGLDR